MELSETQKTLLAILKNRDPERYRSKLEQYGVQESEIIEYIYKEQERIKSLSKIDPPISKKTEGYEYYMGGKPYWSWEPRPEKKISTNQSISTSAIKKKDKPKPSKGRSVLIIIDGDNHVYEALDGIDTVRNKADIQVFLTNDNLNEKLKSDYGINAQVVESGPQAVDNRIKAIAGDQAKKHTYNRIVIVSHDKGYREKISEWKKKYRYKNDQIILCKLIKDALN